MLLYSLFLIISNQLFCTHSTNLPKEIMCYPDVPFPDRPDSYITSADVLAYLDAFAERFDLVRHIRFRQHVVRVRPVGDPVRWEFIVRDLQQPINDGSDDIPHHRMLHFDAVFVCNGHNSEPRMPPYAGRHQYTGNLMHSHAYRRPETFAGRSVLVIGGGPSGGDIAAAVRPYATRVAISHHWPATGRSEFGGGGIERRPVVERFVGNSDEVRFADGRTERYTDVIVCTGFKYAYPFLSVDCGLWVERSVFVRPLFKECLNIEQPTMFVLGIPFRMVPFQVVDLQARFCLAHLDRKAAVDGDNGDGGGGGGWPNREQMLAITEADMQLRRDKYGAHMVRHLHRLDTFQAQYHADLERLADLEPIRPYVLRIYEAVARFRLAEPARYRQQRIRLVAGGDGGDFVTTMAGDVEKTET